MKSFQSGIANRKGQYIICGKAIWRNSKHETLYKKIAELKGQGQALAELHAESETKGDCPHAIGIVSDGEGGGCGLYDNVWTGNFYSKLYMMKSFASSLGTGKYDFFFDLIEL